MRITNLTCVLAVGISLAVWPALVGKAQERDPKPAHGAERQGKGPGADKPPVDRAYLEYAQRLVEKYDLDKNGYLSPNEWTEMGKSPEAADANGDKRVTVDEFARWTFESARDERPRGPQPGGPGIGPGRTPDGPGVGPRGLPDGDFGPRRPGQPGFPGSGMPGRMPGMPGMRPGMGPPDMDALRENDPDMYKLEVADREMERQTSELSGQIRNAPKDRRDALRKELEEVIGKHFEVRQQRRLLQLSRLEKELQRMRDEIERRNERRAEIVGKRITELVGDKGDLDF